MYSDLGKISRINAILGIILFSKYLLGIRKVLYIYQRNYQIKILVLGFHILKVSLAHYLI